MISGVEFSSRWGLPWWWGGPSAPVLLTLKGHPQEVLCPVFTGPFDAFAGSGPKVREQRLQCGKPVPRSARDTQSCDTRPGEEAGGGKDAPWGKGHSALPSSLTSTTGKLPCPSGSPLPHL